VPRDRVQPINVRVALRHGISTGGNNYRTVADQADRIEHNILRLSLTGQQAELTLQDSIIRDASARSPIAAASTR
jgi:hypothetical protein